MEIGKQFNTLTLEEYFFFIDNYKKYSDFNTLGLFRSIIENQNLTVGKKVELRSYAVKAFEKTFNFLQIKDPVTFFKVSTFEKELTNGDEEQFWNEIITNQQKILNDKRIKDRNFGIYSKHNCGYPDCIYNGLMIQKGSLFSEREMCFHSDKNSYPKKVKSEKRKVDRKNEQKIIETEINLNKASR